MQKGSEMDKRFVLILIFLAPIILYLIDFTDPKTDICHAFLNPETVKVLPIFS